MTVQIEGRYLLVGCPGLPKKDWLRVLHYRHPDGYYWPVEPIEPMISGWGIITELCLADPLTGQHWLLHRKANGSP